MGGDDFELSREDCKLGRDDCKLGGNMVDRDCDLGGYTPSWGMGTESL